jgi:hypothetical protein
MPVNLKQNVEINLAIAFRLGLLQGRDQVPLKQTTDSETLFHFVDDLRYLPIGFTSNA